MHEGAVHTAYKWIVYFCKIDQVIDTYITGKQVDR